MIVKVKWESSDKTWYFSNTNISDSTGNWASKIINISNWSEAINENKEYEVSGMTLLLDDSDRGLRTKMSGENRYILNDDVTFYDENDTVIYKGKIDSWDWPDRNQMSLSISDIFLGFNDSVPPNFISSVDYGNAPGEALGEAIPIVYGNINSNTGALKCWKVDAGGSKDYLISDHHCFQLDNVYEEDEDGVMVSISSAGWSLHNDTDDGRAYISDDGAGFTKDFLHANVRGTTESIAVFEADNSDTASVANFSSLGEKTITFRFATSDQTNQMQIVSFNGSSILGFGLNQNDGGTRRPYIYLGYVNQYKYFENIDQHIDGQWHIGKIYIAGSGINADFKFYIDDVELTATTDVRTGSKTAWTGSFLISDGYAGTGLGWYDGKLDWVRMYDGDSTDKDDAEILIEFTEGTGTTLYDTSGNSNDMTLTTGDSTAFWADYGLKDTPVACLRDYLDNYTKILYDVDSMEAVRAVFVTRGYLAGYAIKTNQNVSVALKRFMLSFDAEFYIKQNRFVLNTIDYSDFTPVKYFYFENILNFNVIEEPERIENKIKYMYKFDFAIDNFRKRPIFEKASSISSWGEFYKVHDYRVTHDDDTALDVVQRQILQKKNPISTATMVVPADYAKDLNLADLISIKCEIATSTEAQIYKIIRISRDFMNGTTIIIATNYNQLSGAAAIFGDAAVQAATWGDASEEDRRYAYFCDTDGFFSNDIDPGKVFV